MPNSEIKTYEDLKNNESVQSDINLKKLIKEIDEIKDTTSSDDDKIEGVFTESSEGQVVENALNQGLIESLKNQDIGVLQILIGEVQKINREKTDLSDVVKQSLQTLLTLLEKELESKNNIEELTVEEIGNFNYVGTFVFNSNIEQGDDKSGHYIIIGGEKYYKNKENGLGYVNISGCLIIGNYVNNKLEGQGISIYPKGSKRNGWYKGEWISYKKNGKGTMTYYDGDKYEGEWMNDKFEGQGTYIGIKGDKYEGEWINNKKNGKGTMTYSNGNKYEGEWMNDKFEGQGTYNRTNGTTITGTFYNGKFQTGTINKIKGKPCEIKIKRYTEGIKIISEGDYKGQYINENTGEIISNQTNIKNLTEKQKKFIEDLSLNTNENNEIIDVIEQLSDTDLETLTEILGTDSEEFYKSYTNKYSDQEIESHQHYKKGRMAESIQQYVQGITNKNRDITKIEIISNIRPDLITLPLKEKLDTIIKINKIVNKFNTIRKYLNFESGPYKTPKNLLCDVLGIEDSNLIRKIKDNNITVKQYGSGICFFINDESSYETIYKSISHDEVIPGGFHTRYSKIPELEGTLSVIFGDYKNDTDTDTYRTILHEGQHNRNSNLMPDINSKSSAACAKDEILAYLREGKGIEEIETILIEEGGQYQYGLKGKEWKDHKNWIKETLKNTNDLIELTNDPKNGITKDNIISMLISTPRYERENLHEDIMKTKKSNNTDRFRRNGTAEKQTEINEINTAKSIDEIKHILNDPKYSHIPRGPDNKGGIEISTMIDKVVAGKLDISHIPTEIKQQVQKFIKQ